MFGVLLVFVSFYVWLPDVFSHKSRTIASIFSLDGNRFDVRQTWGSDFYKTELIRTEPNGKTHRLVIDGDADKWWDCRLEVDGKAQRIRVTHDSLLSSDFNREFTWNEISRA